MSGRTHCLVLGAVAAVVVALLASAAEAKAPPAPPRPLVVADGGTRRYAAAGSYCWSSGRGGTCVATIDPMQFAPKLHVPAGSEPTIRMGFPVRSLSANTDGGEKLELTPLDDRRRKFGLVLPAAATGKFVGVYLRATYSRGDALFAVRMKARPR